MIFKGGCGLMRIVEHREIYRDQRLHAAFPSVAKFSDGRVVLAFRRARDAMWLVPTEKREDSDTFSRMDHIDSRSHIALMTLDSEGRPDASPLDLLPFDPEAGDQDPSMLMLPDDELMLASFSYYPLPSEVDQLMRVREKTKDETPGCRYLSWGCHVSRRKQAPGDWCFHHAYLKPDGGYGRYIGVEQRHPVVAAVRGLPARMADEVLLAVYSGVTEGCALFASSDSGRTWGFRSLIAKDNAGGVTYQEPALLATADGGVRVFFRTAGAGGRLATCQSPNGIDWSEPCLHDLIGHPFHPLQLDDGRVLLSYGYRQEPYGIRARILDTPYSDPDDSEEIVVRDDGLCADIGYPWGVELKDGRVMLAYYWTDKHGMRGIEASWLEL